MQDVREPLIIKLVVFVLYHICTSLLLEKGGLIFTLMAWSNVQTFNFSYDDALEQFFMCLHAALKMEKRSIELSQKWWNLYNLRMQNWQTTFTTSLYISILSIRAYVKGRGRLDFFKKEKGKTATLSNLLRFVSLFATSFIWRGESNGIWL